MEVQPSDAPDPSFELTRYGRRHKIHRPRGLESHMKVLALFIAWCILLALCWPLALLAVVLVPLVWLLALPFRIVDICFAAALRGTPQVRAFAAALGRPLACILQASNIHFLRANK